MNITKDIYEYLFNFVDDKDVLNMLSTCKKFRREEFFERIVKRKYHGMINKNESFQDFFIKMVIYGSALKEKYDIPYFKGTHPRELYNFATHLSMEVFHDEVMLLAIRNNNIEIVKLMINKGWKGFDRGLAWGSVYGNLDIVKHFIKLGAVEYMSAARTAAERGRINVVQYFVKNGYDIDLKYLLRDAVNNKHLDLVKYLKSKGANDLSL